MSRHYQGPGSSLKTSKNSTFVLRSPNICRTSFHQQFNALGTPLSYTDVEIIIDLIKLGTPCVNSNCPTLSQYEIYVLKSII
jgi:hypothetical protein